MSKVFFMNNGDFDVRAMCIAGVSAKGSIDAWLFDKILSVAEVIAGEPV